MRTADKLNQLLVQARVRGLEVRFEYLGGQGGGVCTFGGRNWLFVDLAQSVTDQMESVQSALAERNLVSEPMPLRRAA